MKVTDVMSKQLEYIRPDTTVEDAAVIIFGRGLTGMPVVKGKKLIGMVTERDILEQFFPSIQEVVEDFAHARDFEMMEEKINEILNLPVSKIMSRDPISISPDTPLLRAQSMMQVKEVGRLPVVDGRRNLVGIISKGDIFRALVGDRLLFSESKNYNDWLSQNYYQTVDWEDRLKHEMPDLMKVFHENKVKTVLDFGCGTGDHAIALADKGLTAIGVDRSKEMITEANKRKSILSRVGQERVKFFQGDESLLSELKTTFDCVLFMGNTLSHNPHKADEVIKKVTLSLSRKGIMIFQITNFEKVINVQKRLLSLSFAKPKKDPHKEYAYLEFYDQPQPDKTILKTFAILHSDSRRRWKWVGVRNSVMAYTTKEILQRTIKRAGFSKVSFYGSFFDGRKWDYLFREPFKPLGSDWLVAVAKR